MEFNNRPPRLPKKPSRLLPQSEIREVTLPGGVQARGVLRGYRIVTETSCSMQLVCHPVAAP